MSQSNLSNDSQSDGETTTTAYDLNCIDCSFNTTVEGDTEAALDVADAHQDEHGKSDTDHFVNIHLIE